MDQVSEFAGGTNADESMAFLNISRVRKLSAIIVISFAFFVAEITVGFRTGSLALVADAFHYLNDLIGFIVTLGAILLTKRTTSSNNLPYGWARASLLGAFFNGAFLLALGVSIFLQTIERFVSIRRMEDPRLVLVIGCVGLVLNIISAALLGHEHHDHEHDHEHGLSVTLAYEAEYSHEHGFSHCSKHKHQTSPLCHSHYLVENNSIMGSTNLTNQTLLTPTNAHAGHRHNTSRLFPSGRDLGMMGALVHVVGDALNNIGVIIAALVIMLTDYEGRYYADPAVSMGISIMIFLSAIPLLKSSGQILMESAPPELNLVDVKHDLELITGVESVHELHIWRLDQRKSIASAHLVVSNDGMPAFTRIAMTIKECLRDYGIDSVTLQPELSQPKPQIADKRSTDAAISSDGLVASTDAPKSEERQISEFGGQIKHSTFCQHRSCCAAATEAL